MPPTDPDESCSRLLTVLNQEWMLYETLTQKMSWGLVAQPLRPKYYAFNLHSGKWAIVLDPPGERRGEVAAWVPK